MKFRASCSEAHEDVAAEEGVEDEESAHQTPIATIRLVMMMMWSSELKRSAVLQPEAVVAEGDVHVEDPPRLLARESRTPKMMTITR